jgi:NADH:ubiquinone oxidoreductase subunit B-like Fe-S oxidoreductase
MKKISEQIETMTFNPYFFQTELLNFPPENDDDVFRALTGGEFIQLHPEECDLLIVVGAIHKKNREHFLALLESMLQPKYIIHITAPHLQFNSDHWLALDQLVNPDVVIHAAYPYRTDYLAAIAKLKEKVATHE